jgi:hypothetical protein
MNNDRFFCFQGHLVDKRQCVGIGPLYLTDGIDGGGRWMSINFTLFLREYPTIFSSPRYTELNSSAKFRAECLDLFREEYWQLHHLLTTHVNASLFSRFRIWLIGEQAAIPFAGSGEKMPF